MEFLSTRLQENFLLSRISCFGTGGRADFYVQVFSPEEMISALEWAHEKAIKVAVLGGGTNMFFDDAGFRGVLLHVKGKNMELLEGDRVKVWAGTPVKDLLEWAKEQNLGGLEAWTGLPGTVGGAIYGNAGCFGLETKDCLVSCEVWTKGLGLEARASALLNYEYRNSHLKREKPRPWILSGTFQFQKKPKEDIESASKEIAQLRRQKQPPGKNNGSYFKNPAGYSAGALIDSLGMKGFEHKGVQISPHHGNFWMNIGGTSQAILELEEMIKAQIQERYGFVLEREVIFLAENGGDVV